MEQVIVKTEAQPNEEIILFYVDENGANESIVTPVENIDQGSQDGPQENIYIQENLPQPDPENEHVAPDGWSDYETERLLIFYVDNKETFNAGTTKHIFLWSIACKTMLMTRNPEECATKLTVLKHEYAETVVNGKQHEGWRFYELANQAFLDDVQANALIAEMEKVAQEKEYEKSLAKPKWIKTNPTVDEKIVKLLNVYMKHKNVLKNVQKDYWQKGLWENIALEMGSDNAEYWHKRFLNFKNNYIRMLDKKQTVGPKSVNWAYMDLFDSIYQDDEEFQRKYKISQKKQDAHTPTTIVITWNDVETTILTKYYFDCFNEFLDPTIPNKFLWNEVSRLLGKPAEVCQAKFEELKENHLTRVMNGGYEVNQRIPREIILDTIISKETKLLMSKLTNKADDEIWKTPIIDEMVQFFYDNTDLYRDPVGYYVCWAANVKKLNQTLESCQSHWKELVMLYKGILQDKKENPDMQIDWRYIELFDRLFDYGLDEKLMNGYENVGQASKDSNKTNIKKEIIDDEMTAEEDDYDDRGDAKAFKLLEYYQKNKDKFTTSRKQAQWEVFGKQIGMTGVQCAHRFRNLKQVYTAYVQREINKPEMPIIWPYYQLCKKVFGYRALKNKLKNSKMDFKEGDDWSTKDIKELINYLTRKFNEINEDINNKNVWAELRLKISKSESLCRDKFLELRKSYRKLKSMKMRNSSVKVTWKYYNAFDRLYADLQNGNANGMDVDYKMLPMGDQEDDDIQCIFVIPEGTDINDLTEQQIAELISQQGQVTQFELKQTKNWTRKSKKKLLTLYVKYLEANNDKEIDRKEMWTEIAEKMDNKTHLACRKMYLKMKKAKLNANDEELKKIEPYNELLDKVCKLKPRFRKKSHNEDQDNKPNRVYKDVDMDTNKVVQALHFYLQNIEEFVSPRFEKKYAWANLAKQIDEPLSKLFNKINYLKNAPSLDSEENEAYADIVKEIVVKETNLKDNLVVNNEVPIDEEVEWSDEEIEQLLTWYLANLEKFKNPKFVRKYLWIEASDILKKSPLSCSKKMSEIRTEYRHLVKEAPDHLSSWKFYDLCQKIYGTGKQKLAGQE